VPPWPSLGENEWTIIGENAWTSLGENDWPLLGENPWTIIVRKMTYERVLNCNGPRGRQVFQGRTAPDTDWVNGPNQLWDWDGRPFGRLVNISLDMTHHQGWVS
jgi:hypothetical protein